MCTNAICVGCGKTLRVSPDKNNHTEWLFLNRKLSLGVCRECKVSFADWTFHQQLAIAIRNTENTGLYCDELEKKRVFVPDDEEPQTEPIVCVGCGCDDNDPCSSVFDEACSWIRVNYADRVGVCSECYGIVEAWDNDQREASANG